MSDWIENALSAAGKSSTGQPIGSETQACPAKTPPFILVRVVRSDTGEPLGQATVKIEGPTSQSLSTSNSIGACTFDPVKPGAYKITAELPGSLGELFVGPSPVSVTVRSRQPAIQVLLFAPQSRLKVRVVTLGGGNPPRREPIAGAVVRARLRARSGVLSVPTGPDGIADFGRVPAGGGSLDVQTNGVYPGRFAPVPSQAIDLLATQEHVVLVELEEPLELELSPELEEEDAMDFSLSPSEEEDELGFECQVQSGESGSNPTT